MSCRQFFVMFFLCVGLVPSELFALHLIAFKCLYAISVNINESFDISFFSLNAVTCVIMCNQ